MREFKDYAGGFVIVALFVVAIYGFAIGTAINQGYTAGDIIDEDLIDITSIQSQLNDTSLEAENWKESFTKENRLLAVGELVFKSIWGIIITLVSLPVTFWNLIIGGASKVLGIPPIVTGSVVILIILAVIFSAWRTIKQGY